MLQLGSEAGEVEVVNPDWGGGRLQSRLGEGPWGLLLNVESIPVSLEICGQLGDWEAGPGRSESGLGPLSWVGGGSL